MSEITQAERDSMRRKNIIKNIAIVFLVILLILTFFSQTIMNYSLPEVATQMIESGSVSPQIRGTGTIEADDPYDVVVKEIRKISSVPVKVGDHVEKDGILYYLEEQESPDLIEAQEKLEDLEQSYELSLLRGDIDDRIINRVRGGYTATFEEYQKALTAATKKVEQLEDQSKEMQKQLDAIELANNWTDNQRKYDKATDEYAEADWALRIAEMDAQKDLNDDEIEELTNSIDDLKERIEDIEDDMEEAKEDDKTNKYERLKEQYAAAQRTLSELQDRKWGLQDMNESFEREKNEIELAKARQEHDTSQLDTQTDQVDIHYDQELLVMKDQKDKVDKDLEEAKDDRDELLNDISREIELDASRKSIETQKKKVEELEKTAMGGEIKSPVAGTITALALVAGQSTQANQTVAVIQVDGKDMVTSFSVTNDQAKNLRAGDIAQPQNAWYYTDFKATLKSITADPNSPNSKKKLTFVIKSPEVQPGQTVNLTIGERSDRYDLTVPSSAIREDTNGKYILIIKSKASPLGNRYIASRVDVDVLATDDTTSAISGSLEGYEYVITTSTQPVEPGAQVRLANN